MLGNLKKTVKHTAIYSLGNLSTKLVGLILLPLYTSHLTTSEYGILSIIEITSQLLIGFFTFYLPQAMLRWCATEDDPKHEKSIIFTTLIALIVMGAVITGSLLPINEELSLLVFGDIKFTGYLTLLLIWSFLGIINRHPTSLIRLREKSIFFSALMVSKFTIILGTNIYFVAYAKMGVEGIVWGQIIGEIFALLVSIPLIIRNIVPIIQFKVLKEMFVYGIPLAFSAVSSLILASGDRYILSYFLSFSSVGIYSLGQRIGGVINAFLLQSFQQGFMPIAFKMLNDEAPKRFFSKVLTYFTFLLTLTALALSIFSEEIIKLFTEPSYFEAYLIVPFVSFAFVIKSIDFVFSLSFHYSKKTSVYAIIIVSGLILTIVLNILLIPLLGVYGAATAMITSYSIMACCTYFAAKKSYYIEYEIKKVLKLISLGIFLYLLTLLLIGINPYLKVIIKFVILISFPVILYYWNFYEEIELLRLKQSWLKWRNPKNWRDNVKKIKF